MATQTTLGSGLGTLFKGLAGGSAVHDYAHDKRMKNLLDQGLVGEKITGQKVKNRLSHDQLNARQALGASFASLRGHLGGANPQSLATIFRAASHANPAQVGELINAFRNQQRLDQGVAAYGAGDKGLSNVLLSAGGEHPLDYTQVTGQGIAYNPSVAPDQAQIRPTALTQSLIGQHQAQADKYHTQAIAAGKAGGGVDLTPTQSSHNAEIDAARQVITRAGLTKDELQKRTQQYTQTGLPNSDYDPTLASTVHQAMQRKVGPDPTFDTIYRNFYGGGGHNEGHAGGSHAGGSQAMPPVQGARQAPDGNWYVADPDRPGKYLRVDMSAQGGESQPPAPQQSQPGAASLPAASPAGANQAAAYTFTAQDGSSTTLSLAGMQQVADDQGVSVDELIKLLGATPVPGQ